MSQNGLALQGRFILTVCLIVFSFGKVQSADFYVSTKGYDKNIGTIREPFFTISKAVLGMHPGDRCLIRAGVYRETIAPSVNGLVFMPYNHEQVTISGCDVLSSSWESYKEKILVTAMRTPVLQMFVNGKQMVLARYPSADANQNMLEYSKWMSTVTSTPEENKWHVEFDAMPNMPRNYWVGGYYTGRNGVNPFNAARGYIVASDGHGLTLTNVNYWWAAHKPNDKPAESSVGAGCGYIINTLNALTESNEWYWGGSNLYFYPPDGVSLSKSLIEVRTRLLAFNFSNRVDMVLAGLNLSAASVNLGGAQNCLLSNCTVLYPAPWSDYNYPTPNNYCDKSKRGQYVGLDYGGPDDGSCGIYVSGINNRVVGCHIAHSWGGGVRLAGTNNTIENSLLEDLDWFGRRIGGVQLLGYGNKVLHCTIDRTGQAGIDGGNRLCGFGEVAYNFVVSSNLITNVGILTSDTAHFYINNQDSPKSINADIAYNVCAGMHASRYGSGIYLDNGTFGAIIHNNLIADHGQGLTRGIFLNRQKSQNTNLVYNNTVIGAQLTGIACWNVVKHMICSNVFVINNLSDQKNAGRFCAYNNITNAKPGWFINPDKYDYRLKSNTPPVGVAVAVPHVLSKLADNAHDNGAFAVDSKMLTSKKSVEEVMSK